MQYNVYYIYVGKMCWLESYILYPKNLLNSHSNHSNCFSIKPGTSFVFRGTSIFSPMIVNDDDNNQTHVFIIVLTYSTLTDSSVIPGAAAVVLFVIVLKCNFLSPISDALKCLRMTAP